VAWEEKAAQDKNIDLYEKFKTPELSSEEKKKGTKEVIHEIGDFL